MPGILTYLKRRVRSFRYAFQGIGYLLREQPNARIHAAATLGVLLCGWWLGLSPWEWAVMLLCIGLVLAAEAINSAVEALVDLVSPDHHPLAGKAKDLAAGAVLICALIAALAWAVIHIPKLLERWEAWQAAG